MCKIWLNQIRVEHQDEPKSVEYLFEKVENVLSVKENEKSVDNQSVEVICE